MSDDTPTQRFDAPLTPTTPISSPPGSPKPENPKPERTPEETRRRGLMFALIALSAALLVVLIAVLIVLFSRDGTPSAVSTPTGTASASPTPSGTASAPPSPSPTASQTTSPTTPPNSGPTVAVFNSPTVVACDSRTNNPIPLKFAWSGTGAEAYFAVGATNDPKNNGFGDPLPTTGNQSDFPDGNVIVYPCFQKSAVYTIGVYDASGNKAVKQLTVTNTGEVK